MKLFYSNFQLFFKTCISDYSLNQTKESDDLNFNKITLIAKSKNMYYFI